MTNSSKKGFTLIELLVVIAIIGILSAVVLTSLNSSRQKARDAQRVSDIKQIALAMELERNGSTGNYSVSSATMPTAVGTSLPTVPTNNSANSGTYGWVDNSGDASQFCVFADLEASSQYYAASQNGSAYVTDGTAPALGSCIN